MGRAMLRRAKKSVTCMVGTGRYQMFTYGIVKIILDLVKKNLFYPNKLLHLSNIFFTVVQVNMKYKKKFSEVFMGSTRTPPSRASK